MQPGTGAINGRVEQVAEGGSTHPSALVWRYFSCEERDRRVFRHSAVAVAAALPEVPAWRNWQTR